MFASSIQRANVGALALLLLGCAGTNASDGSTNPFDQRQKQLGSILATTVTSGDRADTSQHAIGINAASQGIGPNAAVEWDDLTPGQYTVTLSSVAMTCTVVGGLARTVVVAAGQQASVAFPIQCVGLSGTIAYTTSGVLPQLRVIDATGASDRLIFQSASELSEYLLSPAWRPSGDALAFDLAPQDMGDIWTVNSDGSNATNLTNSPTLDDGSPAWSPDGAYIAFQSGARNVHYGIYVMRSDGTARRMLIDTPAPTSEGNPSWSPDGTQLAFATHKDPEQYGSIYTINVDGTGMRRMSSAGEWSDAGPVWSPDGKSIAFLRSGPTGFVDLFTKEYYVVGSDGSNERLLKLNCPGQLLGMSWSPDGRSMAYGCTDGYVWVANTDGSLPNRLVAGESPAWRR